MRDDRDRGGLDEATVALAAVSQGFFGLHPPGHIVEVQAERIVLGEGVGFPLERGPLESDLAAVLDIASLGGRLQQGLDLLRDRMVFGQLGEVGESFPRGGIAVGDLPAGGDLEDRVGVLLGEAGHPSQLALVGSSFADILDGTLVVEDVPSLVADGARALSHVDLGPIRAVPAGLDPANLALLLELASELLPGVIGFEELCLRLEVPRGHLLGGLVPQHVDQGRVGKQDPSIRRCPVDPNRGVLEQRPELLFAAAQTLFDPLLVGDVSKAPDAPDDLSTDPLRLGVSVKAAAVLEP